MSDYLFMLESHLTPGQLKVLVAVDEAARAADLPVFVTGGAMRDMLGGFPMRDLGFAVQGNALPLARTVARKHGAQVVSTSTARKAAELLFPGGVTARIGMARTERYHKPGAKPQVEEASIHDDLMRRDFTVNSIALSLHPASRGLLLDPANGLADLERRELRANSHYAFYDEPVRMLRLIRFRVRLGFEIDERTQQQYENARLAGMEKMISSPALAEELREIAAEPSAGEVVAALAREKFMQLFSPALQGPKLNQANLARLDRARQMIPFGADIVDDDLALFLCILTENLTSREKAALAKSFDLGKTLVASAKKMESDSLKTSRLLKSRKLHLPSQVYQALQAVPGERLLYLCVHSTERIVRDRVRSYFQKYLFSAQGVTENEVVAEGFTPGTPQFRKARAEMIAARLDGRKWRRPKAAKEPTPKRPAPSRGRPRKTVAAKKVVAKKVAAKKASKAGR